MNLMHAYVIPVAIEIDGMVGDVTILAECMANTSFTDPYLASACQCSSRETRDHILGSHQAIHNTRVVLNNRELLLYVNNSLVPRTQRHPGVLRPVEYSRLSHSMVDLQYYILCPRPQ